MMRRRMLIPAAALLAACNASPVQESGVAALIVDPDDASRAELRQVVSTALNGTEVTLAPDALTRESSLTLEHQPRQTMQQPALRGRDLGTPQRFQLVLDGTQCTLVHENTGLRWLLLDTECRPQ